MARFNLSSASKASTRDSVACKSNKTNNNWETTASGLVFALLLIVCALAVGCSSDKPKPAISTSQLPVAQNATATSMTNSMPTLPVQTAAKPVPKKVVHKRPANLTYADKSSGVSFLYPRKYDLKTGDDADMLVSSIPLPMNFVQPGGVALAAVELPEATYNGNDLAVAFFTVNVNKALTTEQCEQFLAPRPDASAPADSSIQTAAQPSKLILGDLELQGTEAVTGEGIRQSDTKFFHVFRNGTCYEFAVNVTTAAPASQLAMKHVDREKAFQKLEKILATVKVESVTAPEVVASGSATPATTQETPAQ